MSTAPLMPDEEFKKLHPASNAYKEQKRLREAAASSNGSNEPPVLTETSKVQPEPEKDFTGLSEKKVTTAVATEHQWIVIPEKAIIRPIPQFPFRLGLENTKEQYLKMPGTLSRWEPSVVGKTYKTGLHLVSPQKRKELADGVGRDLDFDFYLDLSYPMDSSNPYGHHMDLTKPFEQIVYLAMLESHLVAHTLSEKKSGKKPQAEWYIENAEAEAEVKSLEKDTFMKVMNGFNTLSQFKKVAVCKILDIPVRGLSPKVADTLLWSKLLEKDAGYEKRWAKFIEILDWSDEKINVHEEVADAIAYNLIRRNGAQDFVYGGEIIGSTRDQVISKLLLPENQGLRISIKDKLAIK